MKLVLCSEVFASQNTIDACIDLCGKPLEEISIAVINEAYAVEEGDKRWVLDNLNSIANNFSGELDIIDLLALSIQEVEERIQQRDVIVVIGGDTDYLMSVFRKTGFDKLLPKLLETKVYVGSSAGSMVVGRRVSQDAYRIIYGETNDYGVKEYLDLVNFSLMPHLDSPDFPNRKDTLVKAIGSFRHKVYGLRDDSAILVVGDSVQVIGSEPVVING